MPRVSKSSGAKHYNSARFREAFPRPRETIDGRDNHDIAMSDDRQKFLELPPVGRRAAYLVAKDMLASGGLQ
jgi:hypothetical protein